MMKFGIPNLDYKSAISYMEAKEFFMDLTSLITEGSINEQLQQQLVKSFLHHLFSRDTIPMEFLDWEIFLKYIKDQLKNIPHFLRWIFSYKLLVQESCFLLPGFDKSSNFKEINNTAGLAFLMMSNIYVNLTKVIKLVYSSNSDGLVFDKLFQRITEFDGPTLILIKNVKGCIYGGFKSEKWEKGHEKLQGSPECYIFSLWPKFRNFFLKFNEKNDPKNSVYLNNVKNIGNRGIGIFYLLKRMNK